MIPTESLTLRSGLASDALLSASELVRRCERRVGELVKQGQAEGTVRGHGGDRSSASTLTDAPGAFIGKGQTADEHRVLAGADPERFDQAVDEARQEGNLSRPLPLNIR